LKRLALEHILGVSEDLKKGLGECPEVNQIPLHLQYPLPALKEDELALEGTFAVSTKNLQAMGYRITRTEFDDGDLLTDSLKEKISIPFYGCNTRHSLQ
jgi:hypothetical protein